jgi:hypothetical protein
LKISAVSPRSNHLFNFPWRCLNSPSSGLKHLPFSPRLDLERFFKAQGLVFRVYLQPREVIGISNAPVLTILLTDCIGFFFFTPRHKPIRQSVNICVYFLH